MDRSQLVNGLRETGKEAKSTNIAEGKLAGARCKDGTVTCAEDDNEGSWCQRTRRWCRRCRWRAEHWLVWSAGRGVHACYMHASNGYVIVTLQPAPGPTCVTESVSYETRYLHILDNARRMGS